MTPLDAAEHEMEERGFVCDTADARAIISAFLEAAAEDERVLSNVLEAIDYELHVSVSKEEIGNAHKAAILALKETVNG